MHAAGVAGQASRGGGLAVGDGAVGSGFRPGERLRSTRRRRGAQGLRQVAVGRGQCRPTPASVRGGQWESSGPPSGMALRLYGDCAPIAVDSARGFGGGGYVHFVTNQPTASTHLPIENKKEIDVPKTALPVPCGCVISSWLNGAYQAVYCRYLRFLCGV